MMDLRKTYRVLPTSVRLVVDIEDRLQTGKRTQIAAWIRVRGSKKSKALLRKAKRVQSAMDVQSVVKDWVVAVEDVALQGVDGKHSLVDSWAEPRVLPMLLDCAPYLLGMFAVVVAVGEAVAKGDLTRESVLLAAAWREGERLGKARSEGSKDAETQKEEELESEFDFISFSDADEGFEADLDKGAFSGSIEKKPKGSSLPVLLVPLCSIVAALRLLSAWGSVSAAATQGLDSGLCLRLLNAEQEGFPFRLELLLTILSSLEGLGSPQGELRAS